MILKTLVDTYGVLPPELVETVTPDQPDAAVDSDPADAGRPATTQARRARWTSSVPRPSSSGRRSTPTHPHRTTNRRTRTDRMADQIRVLIVDDIPETRDHLTKLLGFEGDIDVVGAAASGREAIEPGAPGSTRMSS